jgi:hypothetical protein
LCEEPESLVLELLRSIRADIARLDGKVGALNPDLRSEIRSLRAEFAAGFAALNENIVSLCQETCEQIAAMRRDVVSYQSAVLGHRGRSANPSAGARDRPAS